MITIAMTTMVAIIVRAELEIDFEKTEKLVKVFVSFIHPISFRRI